VGHQAGEELARGARVTEFLRHADAHRFADQADDIEVMKGTADAVFELPADGGLGARGAVVFGRAAAHDHTTLGQRVLCEPLERPQQVAASHAGVNDFPFHARISLGGVVVDFSRTESRNETLQRF